jgi:hypothetical protein
MMQLHRINNVFQGRQRIQERMIQVMYIQYDMKYSRDDWQEMSDNLKESSFMGYK